MTKNQKLFVDWVHTNKYALNKKHWLVKEVRYLSMKDTWIAWEYYLDQMIKNYIDNVSIMVMEPIQMFPKSFRVDLIHDLKRAVLMP